METTKTSNSKIRLSEVTSSRVWWLATTAVAIALILGFGVLEVFRLLARPLALLLFGLTLAAALAPLVSWLEHQLPRLFAIILVYFVIVIVLGGLIWAITPSLVNQAREFSDQIPELSEQAQILFNRWSDNLGGDSFANTLASQFSSLGLTLLRLPLTFTNTIFGILLILFISFYMLVEANSVQGFILSLFPQGKRPGVKEVLVAMGHSMGGYVRGVVLNGLIVGLLTFFGLLLLGIDFAYVLGVMAGLLELIPIVGPIIATAIIVGLTLLQSPGKALAALMFMIVLQQVENNILVPNIMRSQAKISPLMSILALFVGGAIGGLLGALIAIPIAAALRVLVHQVIAPAIRSQTGAEPPFG